jgi:peptide/nickel transport system permease protein
LGRFVLKRLAHGLAVIFGVVIVVFVVTRLVGDPVRVMLPLEATQEQRDEFRRQLGFDRPIPVQFADYAGDLLRLDFGDSLWQRRPAMEIVGERLPATMLLVVAGMGLAIALAIPMGVLASLKPGRLLDKTLVTLSLAGLSMPEFWVGLLLILIFSVQLGLLPTAGAGSVDHLILPMICIALPPMARLTMIVRSAMVDELNSQHVHVAKAKNLPFSRVVAVHAFRNVAVPTLTLAGWEFIRALAGYTVVVETVFAWPGLGYTALQAIQRQDLVLLQAIVFVVAAMVVVINLLIDIGYKWIDPRIKLA